MPRKEQYFPLQTGDFEKLQLELYAALDNPDRSAIDELAQKLYNQAVYEESYLKVEKERVKTDYLEAIHEIDALEDEIRELERENTRLEEKTDTLECEIEDLEMEICNYKERINERNWYG